MLLIPYQVDVPMARRPIANYALIGVTCLVSLAGFRAFAQLANASGNDAEAWQGTWVGWLVQDGFSPLGLVGCVLLHADPVHLIGNMLFLWVFGNAICAKLGQVKYLLTYTALAAIASASHASLDQNPSIGASGAINGVVGLYLVLYPINAIDCFWWFMARVGTFTVRSFWMILLWLAFDIWGIVTGGGEVAYWAHVGGLVGGVGLGLALVGSGRVRMASYEKSLIAVLKGKEPHPLMDEEGEPDDGEQESALGPDLLKNKEQGKPPSPAPSRPPMEEKLRVLCACGKTLRVDRKHAGKKGKCPACGDKIVIPTT